MNEAKCNIADILAHASYTHSAVNVILHDYPTSQ